MNHRIVLVVLALALACGGESNTVGDAMEGASDVAAPAISDEEAGAIAIEALEEADETTEMKEVVRDEGISVNCLALVADRKFEEALPVCVEAAGLEPENLEVQQALETAQTEAAAAAVEGAAAAQDPAAAAGKLLR